MIVLEDGKGIALNPDEKKELDKEIETEIEAANLQKLYPSYSEELLRRIALGHILAQGLSTMSKSDRFWREECTLITEEGQ